MIHSKEAFTASELGTVQDVRSKSLSTKLILVSGTLPLFVTTNLNCGSLPADRYGPGSVSASSQVVPEIYFSTSIEGVATNVTFTVAVSVSVYAVGLIMAS